MTIYLPIAEMAVSMDVILLIGVVVGLLSGVFGVGGGFFATPFMIFLGIPAPVAVATQANNLVASSTSGTIGHLRRGNVDEKMGLVMLIGGLGGAMLGALLFKLLQYLGQIEFVISILYIILLGVIGSLMLLERLISKLRGKNMRKEFNSFRISNLSMSLPYKIRFTRSKLYISALIPGSIGFCGGVMASILGIGGGFLLVPAMIYILRMPPLLAAGTSLFQIVFTTGFATIMHAVLNQSVDIVLAIILMVGGVLGAQFGVVISRKIDPQHARLILALLLLAVCVKLAFILFSTPDNVFSTELIS